jgi:CRISPR system Cascade subunit CasA
MALLTLQTNAPSGGRGHRTSVRGGGPLTTIVMGRSLWETVWLNMLTAESLSRFGDARKKSDSDLFPWMGHTRISEKNEETTSQHVNPVQMFWGMPRRIRLEFESGSKNTSCDLCERSQSLSVTKYYDKSYGINYKGGWHHTLTPYSVDEKTGEPLLSKKGKMGGISYRDWLGLVQSSPEKNSRNEPAVVVHTFRQDRQEALLGNNEIPFRLWAFGYDMDNMKACGWYEGTMPLIHLPADIKPAYEIAVSRVIKTASLIAYNVRTCVKKALFSPDANISVKKSLFESIDSQFWQDTEPQFYQILNDLKIALQTKQPVQDLKLRWLGNLSKEGESLFDRYSQSSQISVGDPKRIAIARRDFRVFSSPYNKKIIELLDLPLPEKTLKTQARNKKKGDLNVR